MPFDFWSQITLTKTYWFFFLFSVIRQIKKALLTSKIWAGQIIPFVPFSTKTIIFFCPWAARVNRGQKCCFQGKTYTSLLCLKLQFRKSEKYQTDETLKIAIGIISINPSAAWRTFDKCDHLRNSNWWEQAHMLNSHWSLFLYSRYTRTSLTYPAGNGRK